MVGRNSVDGSQPNTVAEVPITEHLSCLVVLYLVWKQQMYISTSTYIVRSFNVDILVSSKTYTVKMVIVPLS